MTQILVFSNKEVAEEIRALLLNNYNDDEIIGQYMSQCAKIKFDNVDSYYFITPDFMKDIIDNINDNRFSVIKIE